jgi:hypothetical protein
MIGPAHRTSSVRRCRCQSLLLVLSVDDNVSFQKGILGWCASNLRFDFSKTGTQKMVSKTTWPKQLSVYLIPFVRQQSHHIE